MKKCYVDRKVTGDLARKLKELGRKLEWKGFNWEEDVAEVFEEMDLFDDDISVKVD